MKRVIKIGIAEDHVILRQGLKALLAECPEINVVLDVNNGRELLDALTDTKPDIVLLDISMPVMDGKETLECLQMEFPEIKVIMMSQFFHDEYILEYIKNGAASFLPKNCSLEILLFAINIVYETGKYHDQAIEEILKQYKNQSASKAQIEFTKQELKILKLICKKHSNAEIAEILSLSVRTIEGHRYNISKKTNTNNTFALIEFAVKNNLDV
jgi:DNA-binding NarL/FixJ family response regulator